MHLLQVCVLLHLDWVVRCLEGLLKGCRCLLSAEKRTAVEMGWQGFVGSQWIGQRIWRGLWGGWQWRTTCEIDLGLAELLRLLLAQG